MPFSDALTGQVIDPDRDSRAIVARAISERRNLYDRERARTATERQQTLERQFREDRAREAVSEAAADRLLQREIVAEDRKRLEERDRENMAQRLQELNLNQQTLQANIDSTDRQLAAEIHKGAAANIAEINRLREQQRILNQQNLQAKLAELTIARLQADTEVRTANSHLQRHLQVMPRDPNSEQYQNWVRDLMRIEASIPRSAKMFMKEVPHPSVRGFNMWATDNDMLDKMEAEAKARYDPSIIPGETPVPAYAPPAQSSRVPMFVDPRNYSTNTPTAVPIAPVVPSTPAAPFAGPFPAGEGVYGTNALYRPPAPVAPVGTNAPVVVRGTNAPIPLTLTNAPSGTNASVVVTNPPSRWAFTNEGREYVPAPGDYSFIQDQPQPGFLSRFGGWLNRFVYGAPETAPAPRGTMPLSNVPVADPTNMFMSPAGTPVLSNTPAVSAPVSTSAPAPAPQSRAVVVTPLTNPPFIPRTNLPSVVSNIPMVRPSYSAPPVEEFDFTYPGPPEPTNQVARPDEFDYRYPGPALAPGEQERTMEEVVAGGGAGAVPMSPRIDPGTRIGFPGRVPFTNRTPTSLPWPSTLGEQTVAPYDPTSAYGRIRAENDARIRAAQQQAIEQEWMRRYPVYEEPPVGYVPLKYRSWYRGVNPETDMPYGIGPTMPTNPPPFMPRTNAMILPEGAALRAIRTTRPVAIPRFWPA